jgi:glycosyltransferase involved in cell wall biosynthesis
MKDLLFIPIEPIKERYTEQWYRRFPEIFKKNGYNVDVIDGTPLQEKIQVGSFLDINSTVAYKASQLRELARRFNDNEIKPGTIIFFADLEYWGMESVRLMAQMNKVDVSIVGFLHAASYTKEDAFSVAANYQRYTEVGWIAACDQVYVGSEYHKQAIIERRLNPLHAKELSDRILVTKNPMFVGEYLKVGLPKQKRILLTNRLDSEKRPLETLSLFERLKTIRPEWEFVVTTGHTYPKSNDPIVVKELNRLVEEGKVVLKVGLTKAEYHKELEQAKFMVTHSIEENYGYCIAEACMYGVVPIMRAGLSHDEFVGDRKELLFSDDGFTTTLSLMDAEKVEPLAVDTYGMKRILDNLRQL